MKSALLSVHLSYLLSPNISFLSLFSSSSPSFLVLKKRQVGDRRDDKQQKRAVETTIMASLSSSPLSVLPVVLSLAIALVSYRLFHVRVNTNSHPIAAACASSSDFQCFSSDRLERHLDATFAGFVARSSFGIILEDSLVGGVNAETGETNRRVAETLMRDISAVYVQVCAELGIETALGKGKGGDESFPSDSELQEPRHFDAYSYAQFKVAAARVTTAKGRRALTERAGQRLLGMMRELVGTNPTGDPEDLIHMKESLSEVLAAFKRVGYVLDSGITWPADALDKWQETRNLTFQYWMRDPVILPSARRLFQEEGFAQHFSSRTIESLFAGYMTIAREDENFDPREHPDDHVVEQWTVNSAF